MAVGAVRRTTAGSTKGPMLSGDEAEKPKDSDNCPR